MDEVLDEFMHRHCFEALGVVTDIHDIFHAMRGQVRSERGFEFRDQ